MKYLALLALAFTFVQATLVRRSDSPLGIDVSSYQGNVDWSSVANNNIKFAYIKATEGTYYLSPDFNSQYDGATKAGLIRGSYHFARPDTTSGAIQANYFLAHGGSWSADGITLPGAIDLENYPNKDVCYGLSPSAMVSWIKDFSDTYHARTGRYPAIYTTTDWWNSCTEYNGDFGENNPLWLANWASSIGSLPAGWKYASFWQYADSGPNPGDADLWNGDYDSLKSMTYGHPA